MKMSQDTIEDRAFKFAKEEQKCNWPYKDHCSKIYDTCPCMEIAKEHSAFAHREIARALRQLVSGPTAIMVNPETGEGIDIELMLKFFARADEYEKLADTQ